MQLNEHLALYYHTPASLWQRCAALIRECDEQNVTWAYLTDAHTPQLAYDALCQHLTTFDASHIVAAAEFHLQDSPIRVSSIARALREWITQRLQETHATGMVLFFEMTWALRTPSGDVYLREYEAAMHELCATLPLTVVCVYDDQVMLDAQLAVAFHTHTHLVASDAVYANPYFVPPPLFAQRDERALLQYQLAQISPTLRLGSSVPHSASQYAVHSPAQWVAADTPETRWKIRCLGALRVYRQDGTLIEWRVAKGATRKTKTLFAFLLHRGAQGARAEELADLLWADLDRKHGMNRLYHVVNGLRQVLQGNTRAPRASPFVLHQDQQYFLALPSQTWIDYPLFQELCYRGAQLLSNHALEQARLSFQAAERLYTGDFLQDLPVEYAEHPERDWCWSRRFWFREMSIKMYANLAEIHRRIGQLPEALQYADKALALDPCSELANREKFLALHAARRYDALQRQFRLYCESLKKFELGEPLPALCELYQSLQRPGTNPIQIVTPAPKKNQRNF